MQYTYVAPTPTIDTVSPSSGPAAGGTVITIRGTNFTGATGVTIDGAAATITSISDTQITATTPAGAAGAKSVVVTTPLGANAANSLYTYTAVAPTVSGITVQVPYNSPGVPIALAPLVSGTYTSVAISSAPTHGTASLVGTTITYIPTPGYSGPDTINFTATGIGGTSAPATISLVVAARPSPANDPTVRALIQSQIDSTGRFASTQITNISRRMESLHCDSSIPGDCSSFTGNANGINITSGFNRATKPRLEDTLMGSSNPFLTSLDGSGKSKQSQNQPEMPSENMGAAPTTQKQSLYSVWTAGTVQVGHQNTDGTQTMRFSTSGVTAGIDMQLMKGLRGGFATGFALDETTIGIDGSNQKMKMAFGSLYASYMLMPKTFLDVIVGYGQGAFDHRRYISADATYVSGNRVAKTLFSSITFSQNQRINDLTYAPYVRLDAAWMRFNAYSEAGSALWALAYQTMDTTQFSGTLGFRASLAMKKEWGTITPNFRVEVSNRFASNYTQNMSYADQIGGQVYTLSGNSPGRQSIMGALGLKIQTYKEVSFDVDYQVMGITGGISHSIKPALNIKF